MSAIVDNSRYFARNALNVELPYPSNDNGSGDQQGRKTFAFAYRIDGMKLFGDKQNKFIDGPKSIGGIGAQILTSSKTDTIYIGSSVITGYRDDGYVNSFESMEDAVAGKISKSVDCLNGIFVRAHIINVDMGINLIVNYDIGTTNLLDSNLCPLKKIAASEFGPSNDMSVNFDDSTLVLANNDSSLTLIDIKTFHLDERYHAASTSPFSAVDFAPMDKNVFITGCQGCKNDLNYVTLWDKRSNKPGTVQLSSKQQVSCLRWSKRDANLVSFSTVDGFVHFTDIRYPKAQTKKVKIERHKPIRRMKLIGDKLVGFNETNNILKIDESKTEYNMIETGLPTNFIIRDVVEFESKYFAIASKTIIPCPINISS